MLNFWFLESSLFIFFVFNHYRASTLQLAPKPLVPFAVALPGAALVAQPSVHHAASVVGGPGNGPHVWLRECRGQGNPTYTVDGRNPAPVDR